MSTVELTPPLFPPPSVLLPHRNGHQFFVDTKANPPRSIWVHPYDDEEYIRSIPDSHPSQAGTGGGSSHLPEQSTHHEMSNTLSASEIRERREAQDNRTRQATEQEKSEKGFGEKLKEKLTGSTKQERDQKKRQKIQAERVSTSGRQRLGVVCVTDERLLSYLLFGVCRSCKSDSRSSSSPDERRSSCTTRSTETIRRSVRPFLHLFHSLSSMLTGSPPHAFSP